MSKIAESLRLKEIKESGVPWRKWGHASLNANGARCAKIIATTVTHGVIHARSGPLARLPLG
jgi:hypothetical protein